MRSRWVIAFFLSLPVMLSAFQWPVRNPVLTATFGEHRGDHYHNGVDLGGGHDETVPVYPISDGELVFRFSEGSVSDPIPTGLGNFLIYEHEQEYRSVYCHLAVDEAFSEIPDAGVSEVIGSIGASGRSYGRHLHLMVIDNHIGQIINPLILLPQMIDSTRPVIAEIAIETPSGRQALEQAAALPPLKGRLLLEIYDPSEYVSYFCPMSPFSIDIYLDGRVFSQISYEALKLIDSEIVLVESGGKAFRDMYTETWLIDAGEIQLNPGKVSLEVIARDFAGNQRERNIIFTVRN